MKTTWLDMDVWVSEAKKRNVRLPRVDVPPTPRKLKTWARSLGIIDFSSMFGCSPSRLIQLNPETPLKAFIGVMLENTRA